MRSRQVACRDLQRHQGDTQLAVCVARPPMNKGMSSIPTAPRIFFHLPEARVDLPGLDRLQHNPYVHCSIVYNRQAMEAAQVPINREWIKQPWDIYTMEFYSALKKKILPFARVWMDLDNIMLNEISQSEKDKYYMISLICGI